MIRKPIILILFKIRVFSKNKQNLITNMSLNPFIVNKILSGKVNIDIF